MTDPSLMFTYPLRQLPAQCEAVQNTDRSTRACTREMASSSSTSVRSTRSKRSSSLRSMDGGGATSSSVASVHADELSVQSQQSSINLIEFSEDDLRKSLPPDPISTPHSSLLNVFATTTNRENGRTTTTASIGNNGDDLSTASSVSSVASSSYRTRGTNATRSILTTRHRPSHHEHRHIGLPIHVVHNCQHPP
jgi:hypothetical protein